MIRDTVIAGMILLLITLLTKTILHELAGWISQIPSLIAHLADRLTPSDIRDLRAAAYKTGHRIKLALESDPKRPITAFITAALIALSYLFAAFRARQAHRTVHRRPLPTLARTAAIAATMAAAMIIAVALAPEGTKVPLDAWIPYHNHEEAVR